MIFISEQDSKQFEDISSLNHSYIYAQLMCQLLQNEHIQPLPKVALDIKNGLIPDISVFPKNKIHHNFFEDIQKVKEMPILAIEIMSLNQNIQAMLEKTKMLLNSGIKTIWMIEPYGRSIFVLDKKSKNLFHEEIVNTEGIKVDFSKVFSS